MVKSVQLLFAANIHLEFHHGFFHAFNVEDHRDEFLDFLGQLRLGVGRAELLGQLGIVLAVVQIQRVKLVGHLFKVLPLRPETKNV